MKAEGDAILLDDPIVKEIATKHDCTPAQVGSHDSLRVYNYTPSSGPDIICSTSGSNCNS